MSVENISTVKELSPEVITEAAAWIARLHGPLRSAATERGFRAWLDEHADHARAFELATESWSELESLKGVAHVRVSAPSDSRPPQRWLRYGLAAAVVLVLWVGAWFYLRPESYTTRIGEQRAVVLADGTRVSLNTSTRIDVRYDRQQRRVILEEGEAYFEVAKQAAWPFVVVAGDRDIMAVGTAFLVRREPRAIAVTLLEGKVNITSEAAKEMTLAPGERATFADNKGIPRVDRPSVETLTAWQRGKVSIDNLSLSEAATEMNRYSRVPLVIETHDADEVRVSGIFRAGDSLSFAKVVAQHYGLEARLEAGRVVLSGSPKPAETP